MVGHGVRGAIAVVLEGPRGIDRDGTGAVAGRDQIVPDSDAATERRTSGALLARSRPRGRRAETRLKGSAAHFLN